MKHLSGWQGTGQYLLTVKMTGDQHNSACSVNQTAANAYSKAFINVNVGDPRRSGPCQDPDMFKKVLVLQLLH